VDHIVVHCECGETLRVRTRHAGRSGQCKGCRRDVVIPSLDVIERNLGREVSLGDLSTLGNLSSIDVISQKPEVVPGRPAWMSPRVSAADTDKLADDETPPHAEQDSSVPTQLWQPGQVVDVHYEVLELLGQGAFGAVWKVHHREWDLELAVKELRTDRKMTKQRREDFIREAQTWVDDIGMHPNVVTAWYVRELKDVPYLFLEYCDGGDLDLWIRDGRTRDLKTSLDIAIQLAWGLAHCHEHGVVHRDFKPDNVMMTSGGMAKITDFGLVKLSVLQNEEADASEEFDSRLRTISAGRLLGTPSYMAPEQWTQDDEIDHRADLYALGVTIYELLTGHQPIAVPLRSNFSNQRDWLRACGEAHTTDRPLSLACEDVPAELDQLVEACLEKRRNNRPVNATAVAESLRQIYEAACCEAYGRLEPGEIQPEADGLNNQGVSLYELGRQRESKLRFEAAIQSDPQHLGATYNLGMLRWRESDITDVDVLRQVEAVGVSHPDLWIGDVLQAQVHLERADIQRVMSLVDSIGARDETRFELRHVLHAVDLPDITDRISAHVHAYEGHTDDVQSVAFSADGQLAFSGSADKTLRLWKLENGECVRIFQGHTEMVWSVALSADSRYALSGSADKSMRLWDVGSGECLRMFEGHAEEVTSVSFSADGRVALSGCADDIVRLWNTASGKCLRTFEGHSEMVLSVSLSACGRHAISGSYDHSVRLWDTASDQCLRILKGHTAQVMSVALSADGHHALSGGQDNTVRLWDTGSGKCVRRFDGHAGAVMSVALSSDNRYAISGSVDETVRLWDVASGRCLRTFEEHTQMVWSVAFSTDGLFALSGSGDNTMRWWVLGAPGQWQSPLRLTRISDSRGILDAQVVANRHRRVAEISINNGDFGNAAIELERARSTEQNANKPSLLKLWADLYTRLPRTGFRDGWQTRVLGGTTRAVSAAAISADGGYAISGSHDKIMRLWDVADGKCLRQFHGHTKGVISVSLSGDGRYAISASADQTVRLWNVESGTCLRTFDEHSDRVWCVAFSPDDRLFFSGAGDNVVRLWNVESDKSLLRLEGHTDNVMSVAVSADGRLCLSGSKDSTMRLWDVATGLCLRTFEGHTETVWSVAFSVDGRYALSGSSDKSVRLWCITSGECLRTFENEGGVCCVALSSDGRYAISGGEDRSVRLWDVASGNCLGQLRGHADVVLSVSFTADGRSALSGGDNTVRLWFLDWELGDNEPADWDEGARPWLRNFLTLHTPPLAELSQDRELTEDEVHLALTREGEPEFTEADFEELLRTLGCAGFGWLRLAAA